mmetsp:Transcript_5982/g.22703  ORF Transcript_5982/g.22703 Transcript_5982/m.22703 type:complete len:88 (+) Transcript_5982:153-416(+)
MSHDRTEQSHKSMQRRRQPNKIISIRIMTGLGISLSLPKWHFASFVECFVTKKQRAVLLFLHSALPSCSLRTSADAHLFPHSSDSLF